MSQPLRTLEDYELFLYTLTEQFNSIRHSTVTLLRRGASLARVSGELHFDKKFRLVLLERILAERLPATIEAYGYEVWRGQE
jgi:abortive infection bacteriophage resistance protein